VFALHVAAKQVLALVGPPRGIDTTMNRNTPGQPLPRAQLLAERAFSTLDRFLHIEAVSGSVLLLASLVAALLGLAWGLWQARRARRGAPLA